MSKPTTGRTLVIGDIHGNFRGLSQCLQRSGFKRDQDTLISLGDLCDGWPEISECVEFLRSLPHKIILKGNHDLLALDWMSTGAMPLGWMQQGGYATIESYVDGVPKHHRSFLEKALPYYLDHDRLFVHAGVIPGTSLDDQNEDIFLWDRTLFRMALEVREKRQGNLTEFREVYIGHSPIHGYGFYHPIQACEAWLMDTGAGWDGVLSVMDIETKEYWASDPARDLYPEHKGRFADFQDYAHLL